MLLPLNDSLLSNKETDLLLEENQSESTNQTLSSNLLSNMVKYVCSIYKGPIQIDACKAFWLKKNPFINSK